MKEESFLTLGNPLMGGERGSSGPSEENIATGALKAKWRQFITRIGVEQHFPAETLLSSPSWQTGTGC